MKIKILLPVLLATYLITNSCAKDSTSTKDSEAYKKTTQLSLKDSESIFDYAYPLVLMRISKI